MENNTTRRILESLPMISPDDEIFNEGDFFLKLYGDDQNFDESDDVERSIDGLLETIDDTDSCKENTDNTNTTRRILESLPMISPDDEIFNEGDFFLKLYGDDQDFDESDDVERSIDGLLETIDDTDSCEENIDNINEENERKNQFTI